MTLDDLCAAYEFLPAAEAAMPFVFDDGGRAAAGYRGQTNDCVVRAIAIVTGLPYQQVYDDMVTLAKRERPRGKRRRSHPRTGIHTTTWRPYLEGLGWVFTPTMGIGTGCRVHLRPDELPAQGRLLVNVSKHVVAVVDGVVHDIDPDVDRGGTRCVYGVFTAPGAPPPMVLIHENSYDAAEVRAIEMALPLLEAHFDFVSRWQRYARYVEGRLVADERRVESGGQPSRSGLGLPM